METQAAEVLLLRLLARSEAALARDSADAWASSPQARHSCDAALAAAQALARRRGSWDRSSPELVATCTRRAEALAASLRPAPRPAFLRPPPRATAAAALLRPRPEPPLPPVATPELRRRTHAPPSAATAAALAQHAAEAEGLSYEMVELAAGLKRNALALQSGLRAGERVLDSVENLVEANLSGAKRAAERASQLHAASRASCWHTLVVFLAVGVAFFWTALLIRTSKSRLSAP